MFVIKCSLLWATPNHRCHSQLDSRSTELPAHSQTLDLAHWTQPRYLKAPECIHRRVAKCTRVEKLPSLLIWTEIWSTSAASSPLWTNHKSSSFESRASAVSLLWILKMLSESEQCEVTLVRVNRQSQSNEELTRVKEDCRLREGLSPWTDAAPEELGSLEMPSRINTKRKWSSLKPLELHNESYQYQV